VRLAVSISCGCLGLALAGLQLSAAAQTQPAPANAVNLTAKSAHVADSGTPVKITVFRWSTDEERKPVVDAFDPAAQAAAQAAGGGRGRGGRGGRGAAQLDPDDPALADVDAQPARGRGGRRGGDAAPAKPADPIAVLTTALGKAPTVGYLWTNETVGYSIKYAFRTSLVDGSERIILLTDRRLGAGTAGWKLQQQANQTDYEFTLVELRIDAKGIGEGKASLTTKVVLDKDAHTVALDNYAAATAILQSVKR
jgi:hypothetical protein